MFVRQLELKTARLDLLETFYREILGLPVLRTADALTVQAGTTTVQWTVTAELPSRYHFAFNIPAHQVEAGRDWLHQRGVPLLGNADDDFIFVFDNWQAKAVYFRDPEGNVLELIARAEIPDTSDTAFDAGSLLCVSEIGIVTDDVPGFVRKAEQDGIHIYRDNTETFASLGTAQGLLIVAQSGREWYPQTGVIARPLPVSVTLVTDDGATLLRRYD